MRSRLERGRDPRQEPVKGQEERREQDEQRHEAQRRRLQEPITSVRFIVAPNQNTRQFQTRPRNGAGNEKLKKKNQFAGHRDTRETEANQRNNK